MPPRLRIESRESPLAVRHMLGIDVSSGCRHVRSAPLVACGNGLELSVRVGRPVLVRLPDRAAELHAVVTAADPTDRRRPFESLAELRAILTEYAATAAQEAADQNKRSLDDMLAIGVCESGVIISTDGESHGYVGTIDAAQLADMSGANVVEGFPARDVAAGGRGAPLSPLALWLLFRSAHCDRIFVHLGRVARLARLPRLSGSFSSVSGLAHELAAGTAFLDALASRLPGGRYRFDPGGCLAVQGRQSTELVEAWLGTADSSKAFGQPDPHAMLRSALAKAASRGLSMYDLLCSATHFVAESVARCITRLTRADNPTEVVLSGGGLGNGFLLRQLSTRLRTQSQVRIEQLGGEANVVAPAVAAILALLHFDQVPANVAGLTGADTPRVLGRLTPGGPQAWQRLLASCSATGKSVRPLRAAL